MTSCTPIVLTGSLQTTATRSKDIDNVVVIPGSELFNYAGRQCNWWVRNICGKLSAETERGTLLYRLVPKSIQAAFQLPYSSCIDEIHDAVNMRIEVNLKSDDTVVITRITYDWIRMVIQRFASLQVLSIRRETAARSNQSKAGHRQQLTLRSRLDHLQNSIILTDLFIETPRPATLYICGYHRPERLAFSLGNELRGFDGL
ncbi:hypothetical protein K456DRAFT_66279 [Colletotrichum gloeosporioides 23]|nr:hypothetical protein K456DRAFT_66279 [Colletotrichum gloeosporioides 23]